MAAHNDLGKWGETKAEEYLISKGLYIRHRDWRCGHTDIDIICIDEEATLLVFVEVKTRSTDAYGNPSEAVDSDKRRHITAAATAYRRGFHLENLEVRYDIISVIGNSDINFRIEHIEDAFSMISVYEDSIEKRRQLRYKQTKRL